MDQEKLKAILEAHAAWRRGDPQGSRANLSRADLSGANLSRVNLSRADLSGASLSRADLSGANLSRVNLSGANLSRADLSRADLSGASLSRADLSGANLSRVNLSGANLSRADLSGANLSGADLSGATRGDYVLRTRPLQVLGGVYNVIVFDEHVEVGCQSWSFTEFATLRAFDDMDPERFKRGWALVRALIREKQAMGG